MPGSLVRARRKSQPVHWKENIFLLSETARHTWPWTQRYWGPWEDSSGIYHTFLFSGSSVWHAGLLLPWAPCLSQRTAPRELGELSYKQASWFVHQSLWTLYPSLICMPPPGHGSLAQLPQTHCPGRWEEPVCPRILDYLKQPVAPEPIWPTCSFLPTPQQKH